jgi:hypothetical protein
LIQEKTMYRILCSVLLIAYGTSGIAQIHASPHATRQVGDPANVIEDRGSMLEVMPSQRATPVLASSSRQIMHRVARAPANAPMGPQTLGVVFNHAMQVQGYITGEVAFKMKGTLQATNGFQAALYPGLARLTAPNVYVVRAQTPAEFVAVTRRLQARTDVEWVEPIVTYGRLEGSPLSAQ